MSRLLFSSVLVLVAARSGLAADKVTVLKTPNGGIQPQAVVDAKGTLHLIYFKGEAGAGDIFYVRRESGQERFFEPIRVNSQSGSAIAAGTIRGGQLALGKAGRVHVAWNGSGKPKEAMFYARSSDMGTGFEEQRDLMQGTAVMDGGGTVAADDAGNVYVAWHAMKANDRGGEENRKVWVARSADDGMTFAQGAAAWSKATGVCACCSTRAFADDKGAVYMLYRSANAGVNRDIYLLASKDHGQNFEGAVVHKWKVGT